MENLTVIIPAFQEPYLQKTIDSLLENTDAEIIPVLDGWQTDLKPNPRVRRIHTENKGMRSAINTGIQNATTKYIMKCDAHCSFSQNFKVEFPPNWLVIPRRYSLNESNWERDRTRPICDYHYLINPKVSEKSYGQAIQNAIWKKHSDKMIDDTMTFQGSCWIADREYFMKHIGLLDDNHYGKFAHEWMEIGMKYWMGGGAIKVNKNIWYAHLSKRKRHYDEGVFSHKYKKNADTIEGSQWATSHWMNNEEPGMIHNFNWLIEKFKPPTW